MPFPRKLLNENEDIVLDLRPHWWVFVKPIGLIVVLAVLAFVLKNITVAKYVPLILLLVTAGWLVVRYLKWSNTNFVVTTDRLIFRSGVVGKHGREIPLERLNDIGFHQNLFERIIGAGDLMIESAGERGQETFSDIRRPHLVQNEIYRQIELAQNRTADRMAGRREASIPEQLDQLDQLRQRGVISQAEFEAKKQQLLDRM